MALQANVGRGSPTDCVSILLQVEAYCSALLKDETGVENTHNIHHTRASQAHPASALSAKRNYHTTVRGLKFRTPASFCALHTSHLL
jgi:hypothetical protein